MLTRIIAVVIDTTVLTAYRPDGTSISILQGDPRVQALLNAMPEIEKQGFAHVDLSFANPYKDFQEQIGGAIQFFRIARTKLNAIFDLVEKVVAAAEPITSTQQHTPAKPQTVGKVPEKITQQEAVDQIMEHAQPVTDEHFSPEIDNRDTVVAVVGDQIIPGAEQVKAHLAHSTKIGSSKGMEAFYARIAKVINGREHSVEDLLRFMEKNDLPIADDGSLICYKVLRKAETGKTGYVDCHTQKVPQNIGTRVQVNPTLVDKNRSNECSNGLHVARRGYIGGFVGDVCTLVKVAPEDVITVPHGDPNKVRVCGYHVIMLLDDDAWSKLKMNVPMTDNPKAQAMLGRAVSGDHVGILKIVQINGQQGTNIEVTDMVKLAKKERLPGTKAVALDDKTMATPEKDIVKPEAIAKVISDKAAQAGANQNTRQLKAAELWGRFQNGLRLKDRKVAALELLAYKKAAKVSWDKLQLDLSQVEQLIETASTEYEPEPVLELTKEMETPTPASPASPAPLSSFAAGSRQLEARELFQKGKFAQLKELKTKAKVSWARLGFYDSEIDIINNA
jgi:hypothetical protein